LHCENRRDAIEQYYEKVSAAESQHDLWTKGMAINAVIFAGSQAQQVCTGFASAMDNTLQSRFRRGVEELLSIKSSG